MLNQHSELYQKDTEIGSGCAEATRMPEDSRKKERIYCNQCEQETNHELKGEHRAEIGPGHGPQQDIVVYLFWVCMGCDHGVLEVSYWCGDMPGASVAHQFFPKPSRHQLPTKRYSKLKPKLAAIYREAVTCYNEYALVLCAAGLRALLEGICQDKKVKGKNLKQKIEGLQPHLPNKNIIRNLHHFRFMGNDAVHELDPPKQNELAVAISVIEDLLSFFYELDYKASQLRAMRRANKTKGKTMKKAADSLNFLADTVAIVQSAEEKPKPETT